MSSKKIQEDHMRSFRTIVGALALIAPLGLAGPASAEDTLKLAIGQINNWENQGPTLGQDAGIFKKHGLVLENVGTQGAGETLQAVISSNSPNCCRFRRARNKLRRDHLWPLAAALTASTMAAPPLSSASRTSSCLPMAPISRWRDTVAS